MKVEEKNGENQNEMSQKEVFLSFSHFKRKGENVWWFQKIVVFLRRELIKKGQI